MTLITGEFVQPLDPEAWPAVSVGKVAMSWRCPGSTETFVLSCRDCGTVLYRGKGERADRVPVEHMQRTGHRNFTLRSADTPPT